MTGALLSECRGTECDRDPKERLEDPKQLRDRHFLPAGSNRDDQRLNGNGGQPDRAPGRRVDFKRCIESPWK